MIKLVISRIITLHLLQLVKNSTTKNTAKNTHNLEGFSSQYGKDFYCSSIYLSRRVPKHSTQSLTPFHSSAESLVLQSLQNLFKQRLRPLHHTLTRVCMTNYIPHQIVPLDRKRKEPKKERSVRPKLATVSSSCSFIEIQQESKATSLIEFDPFGASFPSCRCRYLILDHISLGAAAWGE